MFNWTNARQAPSLAVEGPATNIEFAEQEAGIVPISVNYFPHRKCNYSCEFCFHTTKNLYILPLEQAKRGLRLLAEAGMKKLNISGGEPFLQPTFIGEIFRYCKEELKIESCSIVNNGSKVTEQWLDTYGQYLDIMAISCDSFDYDTNLALGRAEKNGRGAHVKQVFLVADWCRDRGIKVKINSVITRLNFEEDMNDSIEALMPYRWKVFQVLLLEGENSGSHGSLRDARSLCITDEQFKSFLARHAHQESLVPEDNNAMRDSYLNMDEKMRFLDSSHGCKVPGRSVLDVGVDEALKDAGFNLRAFLNRGGIFKWTRGEDALEW